MDGAAEGPKQHGDPTAQDPESAEGQAQARIRNLEDSLFTLQSQLQLLQSASTGAQHRPPGRPSWRRQGHRPLSQPTMEASPAGQADVDKRASLPVGPMGLSPESPSEPREWAPRQVPGAGASPQEVNGPCSGPSLPPEQQQSLGTGTMAKGSVVEAKGGDMVEVVWEGLQDPKDCATGATGPVLEARVEQVVLEAIGDRQGPGSPEPPAWVREDRGIVEVVWEGLGGSDHEALEEVGGGEPELQERLGGTGSRDREHGRQGDPGRNEGSFIWVERVTVSEDWEELLMEGLEGPPGPGREAGVEGPPGTRGGGGGERRGEGPAGAGEERGEEGLGTGGEGRQRESRASSEPEGTASEQDLGVEREATEGPLRAEGEHREEKPGGEVEAPLGVDEKGGEERTEEKAEGPLGSGRVGEEGSLGGGRGAGEERGAEGMEGGQPEERGGEEEPGVAEEPVVTGRKEGEEPLRGEEPRGAQDLQNGTDQREAGEGRESQAAAGSEAGAPLGVLQEPTPELQPPTSHAEGEEASGPKQKTCQCCAVM
ncbi:paralemmin-3 [Fukomys damarensis]|uniref:paralemmin-3 n=1 Tax=Fukomys damarensis TaxID=885580 RepID=UPI001454EF33|nr:paralemmin-3 [Fukomys damarensis]